MHSTMGCLRESLRLSRSKEVLVELRALMKRSDLRIHPTVYIASGCFLALLLGCTKPESDIGLGLQPESELLNVVVTDTATVRLATVAEDSLQTDELSTGLIGSLEIPGMSEFRASLATQLRLSATDASFGNNAVADSMYLLLQYTGDFYGQIGPTALSVQPLLDSLSVEEDYQSNFEAVTTGEEWVYAGAVPFYMNPTDNVDVGSDSTVSALKIPLDLSYAQDIINLDASILSSNSSWFEHLPGLLIEPVGLGDGVAAFDINSGLSIMRLHYTNDDGSSFYDFLISPLSARINLFEHDFSVGELSPLVDSNEISGEQRAYVLSASGCKTRVDFPHLTSFQDENGNAPTVLKAELVAPVADDLTEKPVPSQEQMFVLMENGDGEFGQTPDQNTPIPVGGEYDEDRGAYVFNLTSTVQSYMKGDFEGRSLYLVSNRAGISVARAVLNGVDVDNPTRLELTFGL